MRIAHTALVAALALVAFRPGLASAQDVAQLVADGRLEEAAAMLAGAGQEAADAGATLIFDRAYMVGFQARDYDYAIQGFAAARTVPNLSTDMREQLNFWHGLALFQRTAPQAQAGQDVATARAALPQFQGARALLAQAGEYPQRMGYAMAGTMEALGTFIEIQEAIIRRGY
jgi:hypothetical protein